MDVAVGLVVFAAALVGLWFLGKWAWRALTFPFRAVRRSRAPKGLGSEYERMVGANGGTSSRSVAAPRAPVVSSTSSVTSDHYERMVTQKTSFDRPTPPVQPTSDLVIIPPPRRSRVWTSEATNEPQEQLAADLTEPIEAEPVVSDPPPAAIRAKPTPSPSKEPARRWWRRTVRIPPWISLPLLFEGAYFVALYPFGIDWYQYGGSLVFAVVIGIWAKRRYRVTVLHRHERGIVIWLRWGRPEADPTEPLVVASDSVAQSVGGKQRDSVDLADRSLS